MRRSSSSSTSDDGPKIVQIETWYVETEAINFRDVVQSLTGNTSSINTAPHSVAANKPLLLEEVSSITTTTSNAKKNKTNNTITNPTNNVSFKDLDPFFADLPSIHHLLC